MLISKSYYIIVSPDNTYSGITPCTTKTEVFPAPGIEVLEFDTLLEAESYISDNSLILLDSSSEE